MTDLRMVGDSAERGERGVVVSLKMVSATTVRLVIDRVARSPGGEWKAVSPVTFRDFQRAEISDMSMSASDVESLGTIVFAELSGTLEG